MKTTQITFFLLLLIGMVSPVFAGQSTSMGPQFTHQGTLQSSSPQLIPSDEQLSVTPEAAVDAAITPAPSTPARLDHPFGGKVPGKKLKPARIKRGQKAKTSKGWFRSLFQGFGNPFSRQSVEQKNGNAQAFKFGLSALCLTIGGYLISAGAFGLEVLAFLGGLMILAGLVMAIVGIVLDEKKGFAIATLIIFGAAVVLTLLILLFVLIIIALAI